VSRPAALFRASRLAESLAVARARRLLRAACGEEARAGAEARAALTSLLAARGCGEALLARRGAASALLRALSAAEPAGAAQRRGDSRALARAALACAGDAHLPPVAPSEDDVSAAVDAVRAHRFFACFS
jgi:hypothetical protein